MLVKHKPTEEQEQVISAVASQDSVMVDALAGCTKSTTLEMSAPGIRVPAMALAFNKKISEDLKGRMPGNFTIKTFNGLGHGAIARALPAISRLELDDKKLGKLITQVSRDRKVDLNGEQWGQMKDLVTGVMQNGITPGNIGRPLNRDSDDNWWSIADDRWIPRESFDFLYDMGREVLERDIALVRQGVVSFDDQVYFSSCIEGLFPKFPVIFVDEAQDLSPLNHSMLAQSVREDGRLVVVGDPKQAIYAFRGADSRSMGKIRELRPSWQDRGLLTTFRCPKAVVARQQEHAPGYRAWHTNADGAVHQLKPRKDEQDIEEGWGWSTIQSLLPHPRAGVMVLCRNNGPLFSLAFKLIRSGVGVVMLGREIGKGLITLSRKLCPEDNTDRFVCSGLVASWIESESSLALANGKEEKVAGITDRGECLLAVLESGCRDAGEMRSMLTKLFSTEYGQVILASIHKAKGLEEDVIIHLDPWRIPSKYAKQAALVGDPRQLQQEWNLRYVAETRTKHTLINANLEDFLG